jgi:hypothetical protein
VFLLTPNPEAARQELIEGKLLLAEQIQIVLQDKIAICRGDKGDARRVVAVDPSTPPRSIF